MPLPNVVSMTRTWSLEQARASRELRDDTEGYDVIVDWPVFARFAVLAAAPSIGSEHPDFPALRLREKSADPIGPVHYRLTLRWDDALAIDNDEVSVHPLDRPVEISGGSFKSVEQVENDINGQPILNTADEPPDPPVTDTIHDARIRLVWNSQANAPLLQRTYANRVNSDAWQGAAPGQVLIDEFVYSFERERFGEPPDDIIVEYWRIAIEVIYREGIPPQSHDGTGGPGRAWWKRFINKGYREKIGTDAAGKPVYREIVDEDGQPVREPVLLDASGTKLNAGDPAVFIEIARHKPAAFSGLGIPI
jgi:hypothetical protein